VGVNCNGIGNLLARLTTNVWFTEDIEEQTINIE
jgi:hypothetical protein